ncbi:leukocyte immunoglobulin-like receptor subfamily A member 6 isoform X4 [Meriones unguiculatus]|uniref:leukocyte immunoglobulin-like receptor subfamily A member 6 isoform X4 n=1 Tax=Meriones unguiculatus TaxID=10047 RepID=UPI00293F6398|nr:leukocyte immunoglobulin-like receptor subfamily A member 6 isoform X4 [Meriones unguiculatus]
MGLEAVLFGFVCLIEQRIWAHSGPLPQASIWAVPGAVVSTGSAVTICCRTPPGVSKVYLVHSDSHRECHDFTMQGAQEVFEFSLQNVAHVNVGDYYCDYHKEDGLPARSEKLELVVTGVYHEKPLLTVDSEPQGLSERNVTLLCHPPTFFDTFIFCRDGNASFPQNCLCQDSNTFPISPGSSRHRSTYRCFGSYRDNPNLWSLPSDPLELSFSDDDLEGIQPENSSQVDTQVSAAEDSQEVTYAQLCREIFPERMDSHPSSSFQDMSTQTCVYAALTLSQEEVQS